MEICTSIEIEAPAEIVWRVLVAFEEYPTWNPFVKKISGDLSVGSRLNVRIEPPGGKGMTFKPIVVTVNEGREFRWKGHLLVPGIFDGEHIFEVESVGPQKTQFIHRENFGGILVPLLRKSLEGSTTAGFEAFNAAIKVQAESNVAAQSSV